MAPQIVFPHCKNDGIGSTHMIQGSMAVFNERNLHLYEYSYVHIWHNMLLYYTDAFFNLWFWPIASSDVFTPPLGRKLDRLDLPQQAEEQLLLGFLIDVHCYLRSNTTCTHIICVVVAKSWHWLLQLSCALVV